MNLGGGTLEAPNADIFPYQRRAESYLTVDGKNYAGFSFSAKNVSRDFGLILINEGEDKAVLFKKMTVTPSLAFENGSTTPIGINLTGTMVTAEGTSDDDVAFLNKVA